MSKININNPFFHFMNTLASFILLNILFLLTCLPILTIGAALTALNGVTMAYAKDEHSYLLKRYFELFKSNFKQATIIWVTQLLLASILIFNMAFWYTMASLIGSILFALLCVVLALTLLCFLYSFPLLVRFSNGTFQTIKNAILIALQNLKHSVLLILFNLLCVFLIYRFRPVAVFFLVFGFAFMTYLQSFVFNKVFKKYE